MAHRHDQERHVVAAEAELDVGDQGQERRTAVAADGSLGPPGGARRVHEHPGIGGCHGDGRLVLGGGGEQVLVAAIARPAGTGSEDDVAVLRDRQVAADLLGDGHELVLDEQRRRLGIPDDEADLGRREAEVDRHRDQAGLGGGRVDLQPLDAIVGEHRDPVALGETEAEQGVGQAAGAGVPLPERHGALEIARADAVGL